MEYGCELFEEEKKNNLYKAISYLIRGIVVYHPFSDMNKSSATIITLRILNKNKITCNEERLFNMIKRIAINNTSDITKIEKALRKCCQKKK